MRRLICLSLILTLLASPALAETLQLGETLQEGNLHITFRSAEVSSEWNGQASATHSWIVVDLTAQTFDTQSVKLPDALSATLTYQGKYVYNAALEFETDELEPLVALPGRLVFRVPLLVAQADPSELEFVLTYAGTPHPVALRYAPAAGGNPGSVFFEQPEDAILFFMDRVAQGDFLGALSTSAASSTAEAFQFAAYTQGISSIQPGSPMTLPSDYPGYVALNQLGALNQMRLQLFGLIQSLLIGPEMVDGMPRRLTDGQFEVAEDRTMSVDAYIAQLDPAQLQDLTVRAIYCLDSDYYHSEMHQKHIQKSGAVSGYTDSRDFVTIYELGGRLYQHTYTIVQFEKGWQILYLNSLVLATSGLGGASFTTEADVQALEASGDYIKRYPKG